MIYRNGVKLTLTKPIASGQLNVNTNLKIGALYNNNFPYYGYMDDFRIYTGTVLTEDQINTIYTNTRINYPIIKNEILKLANPADNDPNIHTMPFIWYKFDNRTNLGLDTMGKLNLVQDGTNALPTYDNINVIKWVER